MPPSCPVHGAGQRKVNQPGERHEPATEWVERAGERVLAVRSFEVARAVLRLPEGTQQAGFLGDVVLARSEVRLPILYNEGAEHREQRSATARFFAPKVVDRDYRELIDEVVEQALAMVKAGGPVRLDELAMRLATTVAARVVGLTNSDQHRMAARLERFFSQDVNLGPDLRKPLVLFAFLRNQGRMMTFHLRDVVPAIRARRRAPGPDVISHLIGKGYKNLDILPECLTFAAAGMVTTREFIQMATWHLLENPDLRGRYLAGETAERLAILEEVLRLEPVVGHLKRRTTAAVSLVVDGEPLEVPAGTRIDVQTRSVNLDPAVMGPHGACLHPDRTLPRGVPRSGLAFGDGHHKCPGEFLALAESDALLRRLLALDLRLDRAPRVVFVDVVAGYALREFVVSLGSHDAWRASAADLTQPVSPGA